MKRRRVFKHELIGSVMAWPVEVDLSRNKRSGAWTIYFRFTDPYARGSKTEQAEDMEELLSILEENYVDYARFSGALAASNDAELVELGKQIQSALAGRQED